MAVTIDRNISIRANETVSNDFGTSQMVHVFPPPTLANPGATFESGTTDSKFDKCFSDTRSLAATTETLDFAGGVTSVLNGATITMVEIGILAIRNNETTSTKILTIGNATAPAYAGLFPTSTYTAVIPAGGIWYWEAPLDGGGLTVTATTGDGLKFDSGANTVSYSIFVAGRSA